MGRGREGERTRGEEGAGEEQGRGSALTAGTVAVPPREVGLPYLTVE